MTSPHLTLKAKENSKPFIDEYVYSWMDFSKTLTKRRANVTLHSISFYPLTIWSGIWDLTICVSHFPWLSWLLCDKHIDGAESVLYLKIKLHCAFSGQEVMDFTLVYVFMMLLQKLLSDEFHVPLSPVMMVADSIQLFC